MKRRELHANWKAWIRSVSACSRALYFFETRGAIKSLDAVVARESTVGHLMKAYHDLRLANQLFGMHEKKTLQFEYTGETFYDWVVTASYYAMYQACLAALAAVRKEGETHLATVCALIHYYVHKKKRLGEKYLFSLETVASLAGQDVQKLVDRKDAREKASYDTSVATQLGIAQLSLSDAREFVLRIREILEEGLGKDFLSRV